MTLKTWPWKGDLEWPRCVEPEWPGCADPEWSVNLCCSKNKFTVFVLQAMIYLDLIKKNIKEMSFCHKLKFFNPYIFETW